MPSVIKPKILHKEIPEISWAHLQEIAIDLSPSLAAFTFQQIAEQLSREMGSLSAEVESLRMASQAFAAGDSQENPQELCLSLLNLAQDCLGEEEMEARHIAAWMVAPGRFQAKTDRIAAE